MLYSDLSVGSIAPFLTKCTKTFDLVVAADVLSYIGDLSHVFPLVFSVLRPGAHFAFTVEAPPADQLAQIVADYEAGGSSSSSTSSKGGKGYRLLKSGRFGYSKQYIDKLVAALGDSCDTVVSRDFSPRMDAGTAVPGLLYVIGRKASS